jgi:DNA-binding NarL/FixJ family response regulator
MNPSQTEPTHGPAPTRLLLVDIHAISMKSSRLLLDALPSLQVVGETSDYTEALHLATVLHPDIVLISMRVKGATGPETARQILKMNPAVRVIFLTLFEDPEYVTSALVAGAHGYVLKQEPAGEVLKAIDHVMQGKTYLSPGLKYNQASPST